MPKRIAAAKADPLLKFQFRVICREKGIMPGTVGFMSVSGLRSESEVTDYREGDDVATRRLIGRTSYDNVVLKRGLDLNKSLWEWRKEVIEKRVEDPRATVKIEVWTRGGSPHFGQRVKEYTIKYAWPAIYELEEMSADTSDVLIETVELANEGQELTWAA
jgi:phage tail-like protein